MSPRTAFCCYEHSIFLKTGTENIYFKLPLVWGRHTFSDELRHSWAIVPDSLQPQGILQVRILEWVAIPFSRGSSWPRYQPGASCFTGRFFTIWATREAQEFRRDHLILHSLPYRYLPLCYAREHGRICRPTESRELRAVSSLSVNVPGSLFGVMSKLTRPHLRGGFPGADLWTCWSRISCSVQSARTLSSDPTPHLILRGENAGGCYF